ncbi:MAG: PD-(D/E)XK nuclease domain-containing protein [Bacteroidaceae bacterium]|nr:PD-(D/E)XK nuclease domain-containing protein [Bacteroidaceae bacterium]
MQEMRSYLAQLPYIEGFKKKLEEVSNVEEFYEWSLYLIFSMLNVYVVTQQKCAGGRVDMVVHMPDTIYVVELKINGTAQDALDQINSRNYALQYATSDKKVVKVGVSFSTETKTIEDWIIENK